ncbi:MAG: hypothetical protein ACSW75_01540 [Lachnospiraceae bacterium]
MPNICGMPFHRAQADHKISRTRSLPWRKASRRYPARPIPAEREAAAKCRRLLKAGSRTLKRIQRHAYYRASMTFECAVTLPLYLMLIFALSFYMMAISFEVTESLRLSNTVRQMSVLMGTAGAEKGLSYIDLFENKTVQLPFASLFGASVKVPVRGRVRSFTGLAEGEERVPASSKTYYITDNQEVYHTHPECTHLSLTVFKSDTSTIQNLRNEYGRKYRAGPGVPAGYQGEVYASAKGDYYYTSAEYHSLVRHVHVVSDTQGLKLCDRCAALDRAG